MLPPRKTRRPAARSMAAVIMAVVVLPSLPVTQKSCAGHSAKKRATSLVTVAPRAIASKPILSFMLETLGHLPEEEESFLYGDLEYTARTVEEGRLTEVEIHILDENDLAARRAAEAEREAQA